MVSLNYLVVIGAYYARHPGDLFADAPLYFRATETWLAGGNPWGVTRDPGVAFAGPPTTLLANLPLQPFGPGSALVFWPVAGLLAWVLVVRRLRLPWWWLAFPPFVEALLAGSPDPALAGLAIIGGGAIAAFIKPYALPAVMADRRWQPLLFVCAFGLVTLPLLPWEMFLSELDVIERNLATWSMTTSAWGNPLLMAATAVALVAVRRQVGLLMLTPALWPLAQPHYSLFSVPIALTSPFLALTLAVPGAAPYGVIVYAVCVRTAPFIRERSSRSGSEHHAND